MYSGECCGGEGVSGGGGMREERRRTDINVDVKFKLRSHIQRLWPIYMFVPPITKLEVVLVYKYSNDVRSKILSYNIKNCTCYSRNMPN